MGASDSLRDLARNTSHGYGLVGRRNARLAVRYAARRDALDRRHPGPKPGAARVPGPLATVRELPGGLVVEFESASLEIRALADDLVLVGWDGALDEPSYAVLPWDGSPPPTTMEIDVLAGCTLATSELSVNVSNEGAVTVQDRSGAVRRQDEPPRWKDPKWQLRTALPADAVVSGLGGRAGGIDLRGGTYRLWSSHEDPQAVSVPAYLMVTGHGAVHCFVDDTYDGTIAVGAGRHPDVLVTRMAGGPLRYSVALGTSRTVVDRFTRLTGRPALPPRWALGHHQSRWGYADADEVQEVWRGFERLSLPLSAVHLDIDHMDGNRPFTLDQQRFGDLPQLAARMAARGPDPVRLVAVVDPGIAKAPGDPCYEGGEEIGAWVREPSGDDSLGPPVTGVSFPGESVYPDFTEPHVRSWWGARYGDHMDRGYAGFWHDMDEPTSFATWGDMSLPRSARHGGTTDGPEHRAVHNAYPMLMDRAAYEGIAGARPQDRPFLVSRSGWAGSQRYAGRWSAGIRTHWDGLRESLAATIALGACGMPFSGPDIGGFSGNPDAELYARWFELASWLPFFRSHGSAETAPREPWRWPDLAQQAIRAALRWRYRLMPYWYTLAREATDTGAPYVRPLAWADPALREVRDAFLLGDDIAVAPVLDKGVTRRSVTLPAGTWYDAASGAAIAGGRITTVLAPLGRVPWFVRAGSVIPMDVDGVLVLMVTPPAKVAEPGREVAGTLWTDSGDGWEAGRREEYRLSQVGAEWTVSRSVVQDGPFSWSGVTVAGLGFTNGSSVRLA